MCWHIILRLESLKIDLRVNHRYRPFCCRRQGKSGDDFDFSSSGDSEYRPPIGTRTAGPIIATRLSLF